MEKRERAVAVIFLSLGETYTRQSSRGDWFICKFVRFYGHFIARYVGITFLQTFLRRYNAFRVINLSNLN